jgi:isocitrate dehydrogenase kinase/phosphatase
MTQRQRKARSAAILILERFAAYHARFRELTDTAPSIFAQRRWDEVRPLVDERLALHPLHVGEAASAITSLMADRALEVAQWLEVKEGFTLLIAERRDAPLAETFYNSVVRQVFRTERDDERIMFMHIQRRVWQTGPTEPVYQRFYLGRDDLGSILWRIFRSYGFKFVCEDLGRDMARLADGLRSNLLRIFGTLRVDHVDMVSSVFYRNKGAYIIGKITKGNLQVPFVIPLVHGDGGVAVDGLLMSKDDIAVVFSFTRSYFFVSTHSPVDLIQFLRPMMSHKNLSELYASIGYDRHAKSVLYKEIYRHLARTDDQFVHAPGIKGMVMAVFTLPGFNVVFKVIRDRFRPPKSVNRQQVIDSYRLVLKHDRVGRLADAHEFNGLRFSRSRFGAAVLDELLSECGNTVKLEGDEVVINHLFTERKMVPLNLYLEAVDYDRAERAVIDYGFAVKELAAANIFPGDLLLKNFGVTRHGRVVFYDYDELCFLHEVNFRKIPECRNPEQELSGEPWYSIGENDVFPEEFRAFMVPAGPLRQVFLNHHEDLFDVRFWKEMQSLHSHGGMADLYPYRRGIFTRGFSIA